MENWNCVRLSVPRLTFLGQRSFFIPHAGKVFPRSGFPVISRPGRSGITAADRDKNNYGSVCLPRDTLPARPTPFLSWAAPLSLTRTHNKAIHDHCGPASSPFSILAGN